MIRDCSFIAISFCIENKSRPKWQKTLKRIVHIGIFENNYLWQMYYNRNKLVLQFG
jgi:hypothetical protein